MDMHTSNIYSLVIFNACYRLGSFTKAASDMDISVSAVSKHIRRLEGILGTELFSRSRYGVQPTTKGVELQKLTGELFISLKNIESQLLATREHQSVSIIRVTAPKALGRLVMLPALGRVRDRNPNLIYHVHLSDDIIDFHQKPFDFGLRINRPTSNDLVAVKVGYVFPVLCASRQYIKDPEIIQNPNTLQSFKCFVWSQDPISNVSTCWVFDHEEDGKCLVRITGPVVCNDNDAILDLVLNGQGLALLPGYLAEPHIRSERLIRIMPAWRPRPVPIYLMYSTHHRSSEILKEIRADITNSLSSLESGEH